MSGLPIVLPLTELANLTAGIYRASCRGDEWARLCNSVINPITVRKKDELPLFGCWGLPGMGTGYDSTEPRTSRIEASSAIVLDYDSGKISMLEWVREKRNYPFIAYTSPSNLDAYGKKFRVVIPLLFEESVDAWSAPSNIAAVLGHFPHADACTMDVGRHFFLPGITPSTEYRYHINAMGEIFDVASIGFDSTTHGHKYTPIAERMVADHVHTAVSGLVSVKTRQIARVEATTNVFTPESAEDRARELVDQARGKFGDRGTGVVHRALRDATYALFLGGLEESEAMEYMGDLIEYRMWPQLEGEVQALLCGLYRHC